MASPSSSSNGGFVLNSWKEIANHLGRGVRTVQRWERDLGMPVRRPRAKSRSAVIAMSDEIDAWLRSAPTGDLVEQKDDVAHRRFQPCEMVIRLHEEIEKHENLRDRCYQLRLENHDAVARLVANIKVLHESIQTDRTIRLGSQGTMSTAVAAD